MIRIRKLSFALAALATAAVASASCTTSNLGEGVKPSAAVVPAPAAAQAPGEIAPLNENDTVTALLSPEAKLSSDTIEAVRHDRKASKIPYIGAWAADDAGCAKIDQGPYDSFTVITPKSFRQFEENCAIKAAATEDNPVSVDAACTAEGETTKRKITLLITAIGSLQVVNGAGAKPVEYVRCELPR